MIIYNIIIDFVNNLYLSQMNNELLLIIVL